MLEQDRERKIISSKYNRSNIEFNDNIVKIVSGQILQQRQGEICHNKRYSSRMINPGQSSVVGLMMNDKIESSKSNQLKQYRNKIIPVEKDYSVPKIEISEPLQERYEDILSKKKKFAKPYSDCTKYIDSLMKNKGLLRRGPNQIPLQSVILSKKTPIISQHLKTYHSQFHSTGYFKKKQGLLVEPNKSSQHNTNRMFDRTLSTSKQTYEHLINKERSTKEQNIQIGNCMNRVLASELINMKLIKRRRPFANHF